MSHARVIYSFQCSKEEGIFLMDGVEKYERSPLQTRGKQRLESVSRRSKVQAERKMKKRS